MLKLKERDVSLFRCPKVIDMFMFSLPPLSWLQSHTCSVEHTNSHFCSFQRKTPLGFSREPKKYQQNDKRGPLNGLLVRLLQGQKNKKSPNRCRDNSPLWPVSFSLSLPTGGIQPIALKRGRSPRLTLLQVGSHQGVPAAQAWRKTAG